MRVKKISRAQDKTRRDEMRSYSRLRFRDIDKFKFN